MSEFRPTPDELCALMGEMAAGGYGQGDKSLTPDECREVAAEVVRLSTGRPVDLRMYVSGCACRVQHKMGDSATDWRDLLASRMAKRILPPTATKEKELEVARSLLGLPRPVAMEMWKEQTGKSQASMYRHFNRLRPHFGQN